MFIRSANLIITSTIMGCLAIVAVALRFTAKGMRRAKASGPEDVLCVIGLILALGLCICNIVGAAKFRFGNHEIFIESGPLEGWPVAWLLLGYGKIFYAIQIIHATAMPLIKASLLLFFRRIFGHARLFRIAFWAIVTYVFLWWFATFWMSVFQCWPISSNWGTTPEEMGNCIPDYRAWYSYTALLNVFSDIAIIITPIPLVWRLQMPTRQKIAALLIIATGIIVVVASIGRTVAYFTFNHDTFDFSYVCYDFLIWSSIEPCLGVVGCCLPTMGPLLDVHFSTFYLQLKSKFSRKSLLERGASNTSQHPSAPGSEYLELTEKHPSRSDQPEEVSHV